MRSCSMGLAVFQDENVLEIFCTTMWIYLLLNGTLKKMVKMVHCMLCVFTPTVSQTISKTHAFEINMKDTKYWHYFTNLHSTH